MSGGVKKDAACTPALFSPLDRGREGQSLPGARGGPRARCWRLCGSRARRAPVSAGLRLQPRSARGLPRHRPPGDSSLPTWNRIVNKLLGSKKTNLWLKWPLKLSLTGTPDGRKHLCCFRVGKVLLAFCSTQLCHLGAA